MSYPFTYFVKAAEALIAIVTISSKACASRPPLRPSIPPLTPSHCSSTHTQQSTSLVGSPMPRADDPNKRVVITSVSLRWRWWERMASWTSSTIAARSARCDAVSTPIFPTKAICWDTRSLPWEGSMDWYEQGNWATRFWWEVLDPWRFSPFLPIEKLACLWWL